VAALALVKHEVVALVVAAAVQEQTILLVVLVVEVVAVAQVALLCLEYLALVLQIKISELLVVLAHKAAAAVRERKVLKTQQMFGTHLELD
jgi:hypothetical protein